MIKGEKLNKHLRMTQERSRGFEYFNIQRVPSEEIWKADKLIYIASFLDMNPLPWEIEMKIL